MGLKHLKEQNPDFNINLIDLISEFDPTKTKKLTPFLLKGLKDVLDLGKNHIYWGNQNINQELKMKLEQLPLIKMRIGNWLYDNFGEDNLSKLTIKISQHIILFKTL
jgi:hypothetical protein